MAALFLQFPIESATCFLCLGEFNRRANDTDRRFCSGCRAELHQLHERAEDDKRILRESVRNSGGDVAAFDTAIEQHLQSISDGTWNPAA